MDEPALVIDCTGMRCPMPVIELTRRLDEVGVDEVIGLVADDPAARSDVPAWCRLRGHEYLGAQRQRAASRMYLVRRLT
ncbi:MAG: sulfurtransferase TusA family protein [Nocardioidaceae bacterium]